MYGDRGSSVPTIFTFCFGGVLLTLPPLCVPPVCVPEVVEVEVVVDAGINGETSMAVPSLEGTDHTISTGLSVEFEVGSPFPFDCASPPRFPAK